MPSWETSGRDREVGHGDFRIHGGAAADCGCIGRVHGVGGMVGVCFAEASLLIRHECFFAEV